MRTVENNPADNDSVDNNALDNNAVDNNSGDNSPAHDDAADAVNTGAPSDSTTGDGKADGAVAANPARPATEVIALPVSFHISKLAYFTIPLTLLVAVILAGASVVWLGWTIIVPVLLLLWIRRVRTDVTDTGLHVVHTLGEKDLPWDRIRGLQFPKWSSVRAVLDDGSRVRLPAVTFRDLPLLSAASDGRIPDPYAK
ncbi:PH domain-containing protein [Gordonia pseudamarae]|jgi:hypothetical protein|uniref:PH domain-containing protein n=1 Tax=Gordonia pseudamarae TaxID=2831662 RepID=A0ABX6IKN5_9ACTN|nr:PH domain-containing protein [Gordonia sp. (in: high G+C Gram-positive bacteria)]QHN27020.1 PH domain-containing protein [Gordonia pseudamarae]QHN35909.1 PH domain-containing protein [Gordonia pseudamarae]